MDKWSSIYMIIKYLSLINNWENFDALLFVDFNKVVFMRNLELTLSRVCIWSKEIQRPGRFYHITPNLS